MPANTPLGISYPLYTDPVANTQAYIQDMAQDMDTLVDQLTDRLVAASQRPAAKVNSIAAQSITPFVATTVTWSLEEFDRGGMVDLATNNTRIQLLEQGIYLVGAVLNFAPAPGTWGVQASLVGTGGGFGGGLMSQRGSSNTLDPSTTPTYVNPVALWYTDGTAPISLTVSITHNASAALSLTDRNFFAAKVSTVLGAY